MKYVPILFSTPMIKSILDGSKIQTRRIIKPQPDEDGLAFHTVKKEWHDTNGQAYKPKAMPGDIFWCRETWAEAGNFASSEFANSEVIAYRTEDAVFYDNKEPLDTFAWNWNMIKWKPSIFMPKEACRLFLKVTNVRVERLKDISMEDAIAEGIQPITAHNDPNRILGWHDYMVNPKDGFNTFFDPRESFFSLWESINGEESLDANPWLFVYDFFMIEKPENFI
jgi:hypothetical protein